MTGLLNGYIYRPVYRALAVRSGDNVSCSRVDSHSYLAAGGGRNRRISRGDAYSSGIADSSAQGNFFAAGYIAGTGSEAGNHR
jgi:hypothetical protein